MAGIKSERARDRARDLLATVYQAEAAALIRANIEIVQTLVEALIERGTLSGDEVDIIIARTISMQSVIEEKQRRADWQRTAESAACFADLLQKG